MERCPACRARLKGASLCPRCGVDLSKAFSSQSEADEMRRQAMKCLEENDLRGAARTVKRALSLKRDPLMLAMRDFIVRRLEREAVTRLAKGDPAGSLWAAEESLYLKTGPMSLALKHFVSHIYLTPLQTELFQRDNTSHAESGEDCNRSERVIPFERQQP